jgi:hypothetical protein
MGITPNHGFSFSLGAELAACYYEIWLVVAVIIIKAILILRLEIIINLIDSILINLLSISNILSFVIDKFVPQFPVLRTHWLRKPKSRNLHIFVKI